MADPLHLETVQRDAHLFDCSRACGRPGAELCDHRIVIHADLAALIDARIIAHDLRLRFRLGGRAIAGEPPDGG